jgi:aspartyl-tRNA(Asn)/glutamyl-tRNA(Gln) amidotransferase subunit A
VTTALWRLPATRLAQGYRNGEFSPVDALAAIEARIAAVDPRLNALVTRDRTARAQAEASAARLVAGRPRGPLEGVPVAVKDNLETAGLTTTWGTRGLADHVPASDELPVARLRAAGAVIVGKTNVPEFTLEGYTGNPVFGVTRNPWNPDLTPGGSSGGSVAGVAVGLFPLALCTDGGGSIRRPASHAGVVGFKPSIGAAARVGGLPQLLLDFEVVGPVARTVDDAALLFATIRGPDARDRKSLVPPAPSGPPRPLRILYAPALAGAPVDPQVRASVRRAADAFTELGHRVDEGALPLDLDFVTSFWPLIGQVGLARLFELQPAVRDAASAKYREMAAAGAAVPAPKFLDGLERIDAFRRAVGALFETVDIVMTPCAAALPWPAAEPFPALIDGVPVGPRGHAVFTGWVNACGHPGLALPAEPSAEGLPIGFQLIGGFGADDRLFELGRAFERLRPWAMRWPASG